MTNKLIKYSPNVDLPEIQAKTGFLDEFTHINESFARVKDLNTSVCAILIAKACNISLTPLIRPSIPALTRKISRENAIVAILLVLT